MNWDEWEELSLSLEMLDKVVKLPGMSPGEVSEDIDKKARGRVRVHEPRWRRVSDTKKLMTAGRPAVYYQVRLGFEFDLLKEARDAGARFEFARCLAHLWSASSSSAQPVVSDIFPDELYEGEPREVTVEFGPEIKLGEVGGSLGKISSDVRVGRIEPVVVGWKGEAEREPRWELRPQSRSLLGVRHCWLLIEVPEACDGARLATQVEGEIAMRWGIIPVGSKERAWGNRPSVLIR